MFLRPAWLDWPQTQTLIAAFPDDDLRFVGGAVRDALLAVPVSDVDAATPLPPETVIQFLQNAGIKALPTGIEHGTITAIIDSKKFEITTLRKDIATDGRHAEVVFTDDWEEDARRRDFTMNALYLSPTGELFDYTNGAQDALDGAVRFIGDAKARIEEDYLRILRFFRFYASYGKQAPDAAALEACKDAAEHIALLSGERVQQEMFKLLAADAYVSALELMQQYGVLAPVVGFRINDFAPLKALKNFEHVTLQTRLATVLLCADIAAPLALENIAQHWKISNYMKKNLRQILTYAPQLNHNTPLAEQKRMLRMLGAEVFARVVCIRASFASEDHTKIWDAMMELAQHWQIPTFPVTGNDLLAHGVAEGKALGEALKRLEDAWEASDYTLSKEALLEIIKN